MNAIVVEYQHIADERIATLILIEAVFLGISCLVFLLELFFVVPQIVKAVLKFGKELKDEAESAEKLARLKKYSKMKKSTLVYIVSVVSVAIATVAGQSLIQVTLKDHAGDGAR
jgi:p-aminobenzoyl-glutamate transporter AbgT